MAVSYEPGDGAPKILATGKGNLAEKIIEKAKENNDTVNDQINDTDAAMAETEQKVNEINAKLKQMEDLLNGTSVDTYA